MPMRCSSKKRTQNELNGHLAKHLEGNNTPVSLAYLSGAAEIVKTISHTARCHTQEKVAGDLYATIIQRRFEIS